MSQPNDAQITQRRPREKYPRMIIVCMMISAVLSVIIAGTLMLDFVLRAEKVAPENNPGAFGSMLEKPREAYSPPK